MGTELQRRKIAVLATDGVEQVELVEPWKTLEKAGAQVHLVSLKPGQIQAFNHLEKGDRFSVDQVVAEVKASDYDALLLPGGVVNPDRLRTDSDAVRFVREFFAARKPVGAICHGPWMLVEAGVVRHRTVTSWPSLRTDICNAGGCWVDEEVHVDNGLVTSRKPADLPAFCIKIVEEFAEGAHRLAGAGTASRGGRRGGESTEDTAVDVSTADSFPASDAPGSQKFT